MNTNQAISDLHTNNFNTRNTATLESQANSSSHPYKTEVNPYNQFTYQLKFKLKGKELLDSYRLRAKVFCNELKWVGDDNTKFETDAFDKTSNHLGVISEHTGLVGTLRFTSHQHEWFMERYFSKLLPDNFNQLKVPTSVEISRMAVENSIRACCMADGKKVVDLLYKGIYRYCHSRKITHAYIIISKSIFRHLRMHRMPIKLIGREVTMPDGVKTVAAELDWNALYQSNNIKDQIFLEWLNDTTRSHNELLWQQPASDSSH